MPFLLSDVAEGPGGRTFRLAETVKVAGNKGPLARLQAARNPGGASPFRWHVTAAEVVAAIPGGKPGQELVVDLKPEDASKAALFRLLDVWGFSYPKWTPLALRLECLVGNYDETNPTTFEEAPRAPGSGRNLVGQFLYVQGGTAGGTWNWGKAGRVSGALLWPEAFAYLAGELGKALTAPDSQPGARGERKRSSRPRRG